MNMTALKARITEPSTCGNRMSPSRRNTILTNRFGI